MIASFLNTLRQGSLYIPRSINLSDYEKMLKIVEATSDTLHCLSVKSFCASFERKIISPNPKASFIKNYHRWLFFTGNLPS